MAANRADNSTLDPECHNCISRKTAWICQNSNSPCFQRRVKSDDSCDQFHASLAQEYLYKAHCATFEYLEQDDMALAPSYSPTIIANYTAAIGAGLPAEDEGASKIGIATAYANLIFARFDQTKSKSLFTSPDVECLLRAFQEGAETDQKYQLGHIAKTWFALSRMDMLFEIKASILAEDESLLAAEQFTRKQLAAVKHISPTPLPRMMLRLGKALGRQKTYDLAAECFRNVTESLSRKDAALILGSAQLLQEALSLYETCISSSQDTVNLCKEGPDNISPKSSCFIATAAYGSALAPEVVLFRRFKDHTLLKTQLGVALVRFYYVVSPYVAAIIRGSKGLRLLTRVL